MEVTTVQNNSGLWLAKVNVALKDGIDIAVGPCSVRVPAQAVADACAGWSALRAEAGEDAAQRISDRSPGVAGVPRIVSRVRPLKRLKGPLGNHCRVNTAATN